MVAIKKNHNHNRSPDEHRVLEAIGRMPYAPLVVKAKLRKMVQERNRTTHPVPLEAIAEWLEEFADALADVSKTHRADEDELGELKVEIAATGRLFRRIMKESA